MKEGKVYKSTSNSIVMQCVRVSKEGVYGVLLDCDISYMLIIGQMYPVYTHGWQDALSDEEAEKYLKKKDTDEKSNVFSIWEKNIKNNVMK